MSGVADSRGDTIRSEAGPTPRTATVEPRDLRLPSGPPRTCTKSVEGHALVEDVVDVSERAADETDIDAHPESVVWVGTVPG